MKHLLIPIAAAASLVAATPAFGWGDLGHEVTALIAYRHLTPQAKARVDRLLAADHGSAGDPKSWAMQSFQVAQKDVYHLPAQPTCHDPGSVALSPAYQTTAQIDGVRQLQRAGIRIAVVLNQALGAR